MCKVRRVELIRRDEDGCHMLRRRVINLTLENALRLCVMLG
jgi:hypothetical protein